MAEDAASVGLAHLLAEATAGLPGAEQRLAAHLRPGLEALLQRRLAGNEPVPVAATGLLVQRHWQQLANAGDTAGAHDAGADAGAGAVSGAVSGKGNAAGRKGAAGGKSRKGVKGAKGAQGGKAGKGVQGPSSESAPQGSGDEAQAPMAGDPAAADAMTNPLYASYVEQAAAVMQGLVREAAGRDQPDGPAERALLALEALEGLDPPLARVARLHWFAGLDTSAVARALGEEEPEARRRWLKARAYLSAATKGSPAPTP